VRLRNPIPLFSPQTSWALGKSCSPVSSGIEAQQNGPDNLNMRSTAQSRLGRAREIYSEETQRMVYYAKVVPGYNTP
jgi:hypothetical protein